MCTTKNIIAYIIIIFIINIISISSFYSDSHAFNYCKCSKKQVTLEEKFKNAFAVFTGEVTKIRKYFSPDYTMIRFKVKKSWKGVKTNRFAVKTGGRDLFALIREGITCGATFKKGKSYMVLSYRNHSTGLSYTSNCGNVIPLENRERIEDYITTFGKPKLYFPEKMEKQINVNDPKNMDSIFQKSLEDFMPKEEIYSSD